MSSASYKKATKRSASPSRKSSPTRRTLRHTSPTRHTVRHSSPTRRVSASPTRRSSPLRRSSPGRLQKDPFSVLSNESIRNVLHKLSPEYQMKWAQSSPKVAAIYNSEHGSSVRATAPGPSVL